MILEQINQDLKAAMLSRDTFRVDTLKGLKTAAQYADVEARSKGQTLDDAAVLAIFQKESKKRAEAADLYKNANETERAEKELSEKAIIDAYLPAQMSEDDIRKVVDEVAAEMGGVNQQTMGRVIGAVKAKVGNSADGALIAQIVKSKLE